MADSPAAARIAAWRADPALWVREVLGADPDAWQRDYLAALASTTSAQRIALQACAGPGKSAALAWTALWFLSVWGTRVDHPKGAAVSIDADNLRDNLWAEVALWRARSELLTSSLSLTSERLAWRGYEATAFVAARTWSKRASADEQAMALSGLHGQYVLALIDESGGIPPAITRKAEQALSTGPRWARIVQAGNPLTREGALYEAATSRDWRVIRITGDPDDPERSPRINIEWARERIARYGRENPWVQAYILGEFPESSINTLLSPDEVREAIARPLMHDAWSWSQPRLGVDVARYGDDRTVIYPRQGLISWRPVIMRHARDSAVSVDIAGHVLEEWSRHKSELVLIDNTGGWGAGAYDVLRAGGQCEVVGVQFGGTPILPRFANRRAEMWWSMAEWIRRGGSIAQPEPEGLVEELTQVTYTYRPDGRLLIESKDQLKERLGRSPDVADALALTFGMGESPGRERSDVERLLAREPSSRARLDYDPTEGF